MTDFRALCQELMDAIDSGIPVERIKQSPLAVRVDAALAQPEPQGPTGRPAIEPVPVSERLPEPEDCDAKGRCWWWDADDDMWRLSEHRPWLLCWTHWLPHWALPVPGVEGVNA
jgi:hypothetical protein